MAANLVAAQFDIDSADGWQRLHPARFPGKGILECHSSEILIRYRGGAPVRLRDGGVYPLDGVDLHELEISTAEAEDQTLVVWCYSR